MAVLVLPISRRYTRVAYPVLGNQNVAAVDYKVATCRLASLR